MNWPSSSQGALASPEGSLSFQLLRAGERLWSSPPLPECPQNEWDPPAVETLSVSTLDELPLGLLLAYAPRGISLGALWTAAQARGSAPRESPAPIIEVGAPRWDDEAAERLLAAISERLEHTMSVMLDRIDQVVAEFGGGILRFSTAVKLLPIRDADARRWLRRENLVGDLDGREVVIRDDMTDRLRERETRKRPRRNARKPTTSLPRVSLD